MGDQKSVLWTCMPSLIVMAISICLLWGYIIMAILESIDLTVALIGAGGVIAGALIGGLFSLIVQGRQLKKDGKTIDHIDSNTTKMKPKVDRIDSTVNDLVPSIIRIEERSAQINQIASSVESFNQMKKYASDNTIAPEELLAQMADVFESQANFVKQHAKDQERIAMLETENTQLRATNKQLEMALKQERQKNRPVKVRSRDIELER